MSYQPEPDYEKEYPRIFRWKRRIVHFIKERPVAFLLRLWLVMATVTVLKLVTKGLEGFDKLWDKPFLLYALIGWAIPFILWICIKKVGGQ